MTAATHQPVFDDPFARLAAAAGADASGRNTFVGPVMTSFVCAGRGGVTGGAVCDEPELRSAMSTRKPSTAHLHVTCVVPDAMRPDRP